MAWINKPDSLPTRRDIIEMAVGCLMAFGLTASLWNFGAVISGSPAFVENARVVGVFGQWRVRDNIALYDRPAYLFQNAFAYLNADAVISAATESADEIADVETGATRAGEAAALLEQSLRLDPANAHAWAALAWARTDMDQGFDIDIEDDVDMGMEKSIASARRAMAASWDLAPYHADLALTRLGFAELLAGPLAEFLEPPLTGVEKANIARDLQVMERHRELEYELFVESLEEGGISFD